MRVVGIRSLLFTRLEGGASSRTEAGLLLWPKQTGGKAGTKARPQRRRERAKAERRRHSARRIGLLAASPRQRKSKGSPVRACARLCSRVSAQHASTISSKEVIVVEVAVDIKEVSGQVVDVGAADGAGGGQDVLAARAQVRQVRI